MKGMEKNTARRFIKTLPLFGLIISILLCIYGWKTGLFTSQEKLQNFIKGFGFAGVLVFIVFQTAQVVVPVLPGGIGCLAGALIFGTWKGFLYNYLGICLGSVLAFLVARIYGKPILRCLFSRKLIDKYESWTLEKDRFAKLFAAAIFLPVAPDDFLCYLAGTTEMSLQKFTAIILVGKPFGIGLYSMGLMAVFKHISALIGG